MNKDIDGVAPSALFISEKTILSVCLIIQNRPDSPISADDLIKYQYGDMSKGNACQSLITLKKLGILDGENLPTDLGKEWANPKTRLKATRAIVSPPLYPIDAISTIKTMTNKEFALWMIGQTPMSPNIALKNASTLRILLRICHESQSKQQQKKREPSQDACRAEIRVSVSTERDTLRKIFELAKETGLTVVME